MNISYNWLKTYVDTELSPVELADLLTSVGLEVGGVEKTESIKGGLQGLVIGKVLTCIPHPDSDHLSLTSVDVGADEPLSVVCGAPNVAAGQTVVVATVGTVLYTGDKEFTIKKSKIRGEISEGMICSETEIGVGNDASGIIMLPNEVKSGTPAAQYFDVETDWKIEVDITPNRIDGASHLGAARDVAAALRLSSQSGYRRPSVDDFAIDNHGLDISVEVPNTGACPRYSGVTISGVDVKPSPSWLQNRLRTIGLTPINNVVDITNFVLFETGQPLHAFDADKIIGGKIIVKTATPGSPFVTLDGVERKLDGNDLMISNAASDMCIAGVFGGLESGVSESTVNLFLESACFDPIYVRKTARRHGLNTDASFHFERGSDINGTIYALKRAALLIKEIAGGTISSEIKDVYPNPIDGFRVDVSYKNINRLIGKVISPETLREIMALLEIKIEAESSTGLSLLIPTYRVDVLREADVIEEVLRIYGYNNVEIPIHVNASLNNSPHPDPNQVKNTVSDYLVARGFNEMWSNSLTKAAYYDNMNDFKAENTVRLFNPLSSDLNGMRQTLLFGGLECIQLNTNHRNSNLRLFEFGNCYSCSPEKKSENPLDKYCENEYLSLFVTGTREMPNWNTPDVKTSFFALKSYSENILARLGIEAASLNTDDAVSEIFSEGISCKSKKGTPLLEMGIVAPGLLKKFDIDNPVYFANFNWTLILKEVRKNKIVFKELPKYPEVRRDLALVLEKNVKFGELKSIAFAAERNLLRSVNLFDVYEGKGIPEGKKSYAINFVLRDDTKTLTDKQIDKVMSHLVDAYEKRVGAKLR
ncbi:MAG: phenylalanine--tRNA ligase subunit beta [Prolixibacteraceae bacterium]|nr:phenylalanine--tRNA ligase subunit beta [Prolixibacteraceae bacterium]